MWPSVCGAYASATSSRNSEPRTASQFDAVPATVRRCRWSGGGWRGIHPRPCTKRIPRFHTSIISLRREY